MPHNLQPLLKELFSGKDLDKLRKFGGRVIISVTAPFVDRKGQDGKLDINLSYLETLKSDRKKSMSQLNNLTRSQLKKVGKLLDYPLSSKSSVREMRKGIFDHLNSADTWSKISGE